MKRSHTRNIFILLSILFLAGPVISADEPLNQTENEVKEQTINTLIRTPSPELIKPVREAATAENTTANDSESSTDTESGNEQERAFISVTILFANMSSSGLTLVSDSLAHGCWDSRPDTIRAKSVVTLKSSSCGFATGTEGTVVYKDSDNNTFSIYFDNPYIGSNSYSVSSSSGNYKMTYTGGSGEESTIKVYLTPVTTPAEFTTIVASDSQAWRLGTGDPNSVTNQIPWENLNTNVVNAINNSVSNNGAAFMIFNGDQTEFGRQVTRDSFHKVYDRLTVPYLYGLGNHDYANNVGECTEGFDLSYNACARWTVQAMANDIETYKYLMPYNFSSDFASYGAGSLAYSWDYGNFHFVQLQNFPTYDVELDHYSASTIFINSSMDWLENDLKAAAARGKIPILNFHDYAQHFVQESSADEKKRFKDMIDNYNVLAIFGGHTHSFGQQNAESNSPLYGRARVFNSGSLFFGDFLVVDFKQNCLTTSVWNGKSGSPQKVTTYKQACSRPEDYSIQIDAIERVPAGETFTIPYILNADDHKIANSHIHAEAPPNTKIIDMSHDSDETLTISADGKTADIRAKSSGGYWNKERNITLQISNENKINDTLIGSLQYYSADNKVVSKRDIVVPVYSVYFAQMDWPGAWPGGTVTTTVSMLTSKARKLPGSRIEITAPPDTSIISVDSSPDSSSISADGTKAVISPTSSSENWSLYHYITLSIHNNAPPEQRLDGKIQYISSSNQPGEEFLLSVFTSVIELYQNRYVYTAPGSSVDIPITLKGSGQPQIIGSHLDVNFEYVNEHKVYITDMSHDGAEKVTISEDGKRASVTATDSSHPWAENRTITVRAYEDAIYNEDSPPIGIMDFVSNNGAILATNVTTAIIFDDNKFALRQPRSYAAKPGETVIMPLLIFTNINYPAVVGSQIVVTAPEHTTIADMSYEDSEVLNISEDGKTATVTADGSQSWNSTRTLTLMVDRDAPTEGLLNGKVEYMSGGKVRGSSYNISLIMYPGDTAPDE